MINGILNSFSVYFCQYWTLYVILGDLLWQMQRDCPLDHGDAEPKK